MQILQRDTLHLNLLHQFLFVSIQSVQRINTVVRSLMCGRIIEHKQRMEVAKCLLCSCAFHFLRLIHDDDGAIGCNHIDRSASVEIVSQTVDDTSIFVFCTLFQRSIKGLRVDNHHIDVGIAAVAVYFLEVATVVDETVGILVVLHLEVLF